jgi:hypothetical protein
MIIIMGIFAGVQGSGRGKENNRELIILKYIASVYEDNITKCIKSYLIGEQGDRGRGTNRGVNGTKV